MINNEEFFSVWSENQKSTPHFVIMLAEYYSSNRSRAGAQASLYIFTLKLADERK